MIDTELLARVTARVREVVADEPLLAETAVADLFHASMRDNLAGVLEPQIDGTMFVLTGDIPAMWLRDSAAQVRPYLVLCRQDPALADLLVAVLHRQLAYLVLDPYANAFKRLGDVSPHQTDLTYPPGEWNADVWERKYEIDSLCFPLDLGHRLWQITGRTDVLDERYRAAARAAIALWRTEQDHSRSSYRFVRPGDDPTQTLSRDGLGEPVGSTGMTWSGFRPSDDACTWNFNVPANMFAVAVLDKIIEIAELVFADDGLAADARALRTEIADGIEQHGVHDDPTRGSVYAYEVDGLGHQALMDDANMPSLLSAPLSGYLAIDDPRYLATRSFVLSEENPYFFTGSAASGIGSPHTPPDHIWPIALAVQGLTATERAEKVRVLRTLCDTTGGTGQMHEGFHCDDPTRFTRPWFSWSNAMFCELVLDLAGLSLDQPLG